MKPSSSRQRVVAITAGHSFGDRMLRRLSGAGISLDALVVTARQNTPRAPLGGAGSLRATLRARWRAWRRWRRLTKRISAVESLADARLPSILVRARPDLLVLAGTGIVPSALLEIPTMATLNAHPGLLPWVRGVCALEHALLRGVPLGVTVHAVDKGIDTGPIIRRVLLPLGEGETDRIALSRRLEDAAIEALLEVVSATLGGQPLLPRAQATRHAYGQWVTDAERAVATELLANGEAHRLYETWREAAGHDVLPDEDESLPRPSAAQGAPGAQGSNPRAPRAP